MRAITSDELLAWVGVMNVAFHNHRPPEAGAAFRRELLDDDFSRRRAAFDDARLIGTYESFAAQLDAARRRAALCRPTRSPPSRSCRRYHRRGALTRMITHDLQLPSYAARWPAF